MKNITVALLLVISPITQAAGYFAVVNNIGEIAIPSSYQQKYCIYDHFGDEVRIRWAKYGVCPYSVKYNDVTGEWKEMSEY